MAVPFPADCSRYLFRVAPDLLEIDLLELDATLQQVFAGLADGDLFELQFPATHPSTSSEGPSQAGPGEKSRRRSHRKTVLEVVVRCTLDSAQGVVTGAGLGSYVQALLENRSQMLVIEPIGPEAPVPASSLPVASSPSPRPNPSTAVPRFAVFPPSRIFLAGPYAGAGQQSETGWPEGVEEQTTRRGTVRFHHGPAAELLTEMAQWPPANPPAVTLHEQGRQLSLRRGFDTLLSLTALRDLRPYPHQIRTVERALRQMRGRALLCDEVGLGKTIEAGLILYEYILRGLVHSALILTPSSLLDQWREELVRKFDLPFMRQDHPDFQAASHAWTTFPYIVASLDTAKREPHRAQILQASYDLVVVDEAHHLKNRNTQAWKFVSQLNKKYILLLTATPIENSMDELFNLITLLKPGQLLTASEYKRKFVGRKDPLQPQNVPELKRLIQTVMIRNRRSTTGVIEVGRTADTMILPPNRAEQEFYLRLTAYLKHSRGQTGRPGAFPAFMVKNLLRQAGSSAACTVPTLRKLVAADSAASLEFVRLSELAQQPLTSAKMEHLTQLLKHAEDQTVVFTSFLETHQAIASVLYARQIAFTSFHGSMSRAEKEASIQRFRDGIPVLLSTESGGEGRNLQFCHRLINFDIPWNPMRLEQRIGRLHRIGQNHPVQVTNLVAAGTMEQHILHILDEKINMFQLVIGELDMILGSLDDARDFEDLVLEVWQQSRDEPELLQGMEALGDALVSAKDHYQKVREIDDKILTELAEHE